MFRCQRWVRTSAASATTYDRKGDVVVPDLDTALLQPPEHDRRFISAAGPILLRHHCHPSLVEQLRADPGLRAFARESEREHALLLGLSQRVDSSLTLAYTEAGVIVGQVTLAPLDGWWAALSSGCEIAFEVSEGWRQLGIARQMLNLAFEQEPLEHRIVLAIGLSWHWDTQGLGISPFGYRALIERLGSSYGFAEYMTSEPNIQSDPANMLLARIGSAVDQETIQSFFECLFRSDTMPGLL